MAETTQVVDENTRIHTKGGERMEKTEFSGFFVHTLDQKNRVFIPAEFRSKLGTEFVVCTPPGSTDCIIIYTFEEWDRYFENLRVLCKGTTRAYAERIASSSKRCSACRLHFPARGVAALGAAIRFDLLLLSAVAQPLAALPPYGCGTPLAGAALLIL